MPRFPDLLRHWPGTAFAPALKQALESRDSDTLKLRQAADLGGSIDDASIRVTLLDAR